MRKRGSATGTSRPRPGSGLHSATVLLRGECPERLGRRLPGIALMSRVSRARGQWGELKTDELLGVTQMGTAGPTTTIPT